MLANIKRSFTRSYGVRFVYWLFGLNLVDLAVKYLPTKRRQRDKKRVVFVRLDGIGDYVIWAHTLDALEEIYPRDRWERTLVGNELWRDIAERERFFDECIFLEPKRAMSDVAYRFQRFRQIRSLAAEVIVNPRLTREFILMDSIVRVSGVATRIGSRGIANRMTPMQTSISDRWYTKLAESPKRTDHELTSNFRFLKALQNAPVASESLRRLPASQDHHVVQGNYAVFFPGAQQGDKMWPVEKFAETAKNMAERFGYEIVVCGGPNDGELAAKFRELFGSDFIDLVGKVSLSEMCGVIKNAKLLITNDTGAGHIGVAENCPTVVITPGNHVGRFFPYPDHIGARQISVVHELPCFGCDWHCVFNEIPPGLPKPCVSEILVADVIAAVERLLPTDEDARFAERFEKALT